MILLGLNLPLAEVITILHVLIIIMLFRILKRFK